MKSLLHIKTIDLLVQVFTLGCSLLYCTCQMKFESMFVFYFLVGTNQVLSCIINLFLDRRLRIKSRRYYEWLLVFLAALALLSVLLFALKVDSGRQIGLILMFCFVYLSPFFAIWYFIITINEFFKIREYARRRINISNH